MKCKLSDFAEICYGKNQKDVLDSNGSVPIYGTGGLMGHASRSLYERPSVLIGRKGTIDKVRYVDHPFWTVDTLFYTKINESIIDPYYFFCAMKTIDLKQMNEGTTIPSLRTETLNKIEFDLPPLLTQRKVAGILKNIDLKIVLNQRINGCLWSQMMSYYEKKLSAEEGRQIHVSTAVRAANTGADAIQKAPIVNYDTGVRCIRVGDLTNSRDFMHWGFAKVSPDVFETFKLKKGDLVVSRTASLGLSTLINENIDAVCNNGLIRLKIDSSIIDPMLMFLEFKTTSFLTYINRITGETSVRPNMKIDYLLGYSFKCLSLAKQREMLSVITPLFSRIMVIQKENNGLGEMRDALIPKLMSGEIDVGSIKIG